MSTNMNTVYLCMTAYGWGSSKKSVASALQMCRYHNGSEHVKKYGYVVYKVHPDFEIDPVNGTIYTPKGHTPERIMDRRTQPKPTFKL